LEVLVVGRGIHMLPSSNAIQALAVRHPNREHILLVVRDMGSAIPVVEHPLVPAALDVPVHPLVLVVPDVLAHLLVPAALDVPAHLHALVVLDSEQQSGVRRQ
jgi:hypothetical protein